MPISSGDEDQLENDIDSFATYYFNWQFPKTLKYCTQSSEPWLRYAASNVHQADVDLLRTKLRLPTIEINDIDFSDDGATPPSASPHIIFCRWTPSGRKPTS